LNATGSALNQTTANTFTVAPVRNDVANTAQVMFYNTTSKEITYGNTISVAGNITGGNILGNGRAMTGILFSNTGDATTASLTVDDFYLSATTALNVTDSGASAYLFDQYPGNNPTIYAVAGSTLAFRLAVTGHPFLIQSSGANYSTGLNHVTTSGTVSTDSSAQGQVAGTLYWKIPGNISGTYTYQCSVHAGMVGNIVVGSPTAVSVTGNITGGNILTAGLISATGNVSGGNLNVTGNIVDTGALSVITGSNGNIALAPNGTGIVTVSSAITVTGNVTGGNLAILGNSATITTANYSIGYLNIPQVSFAANATIGLTDAGKHYYSTSASNLALTIANNTSVSWTVGTAITIVNRGSANITIAQDTGVSLYLAGNSTAANRTMTTYGMSTLMNVAANVWMITGTGVV
jgi:plastocyanin